jgi:hypothetical protein
MFRVNTTRRSTKRALSPLRPATDISGAVSLPMGLLPLPPLPLSRPTAAGGAGASAGASASASTATLEKSMTSFFEAETAATLLTKPWLRLERGIRLQKFRAFAEAYPGLSTEEKAAMYAFLVRANDSKQLNTKSQIQYENGVIQSIKGLKIIRTGDPTVPAVFKIEPLRQTKRHASSD